MTSGVRADTSKRLGSLLLKGWAMLAENCPDCQVPLMKDRDVEERVCVNCDTTFVPDHQGLRPTSKRSKDTPHTSTQQEPSLPQPALYKNHHDRSKEDEDAYDPLADPRLGPFSTPVDTLARTSPRGIGPSGASRAAGLGSKPLTTTTIAAVEASPGKDRKDTESTTRGTGSPPASSVMANGVGGIAASRPGTRTSNSDEVADMLSAKMLQGWTLLDKHCPRCNTVLVRSKINKRMFCVACDAFLFTEEDTQPQQHQQQHPKQQQLTETQQLSLSQSLSSSSSLNRNKLSTRVGQQQQSPPQLPSALSATLGRSTVLSQPPVQQQYDAQPHQPLQLTTFSSAPLSVLNMPVAQLLAANQQQLQQFPSERQTGSQPGSALWGSARGSAGAGDTSLLSSISRTVALKMLEAQSLLEATPSGDTERARSYVSLISSYLDVLAKVQSLQQQLA